MIWFFAGVAWYKVTISFADEAVIRILTKRINLYWEWGKDRWFSVLFLNQFWLLTYIIWSRFWFIFHCCRKFFFVLDHGLWIGLRLVISLWSLIILRRFLRGFFGDTVKLSYTAWCTWSIDLRPVFYLEWCNTFICTLLDHFYVFKIFPDGSVLAAKAFLTLFALLDSLFI